MLFLVSSSSPTLHGLARINLGLPCHYHTEFKYYCQNLRAPLTTFQIDVTLPSTQNTAQTSIINRRLTVLSRSTTGTRPTARLAKAFRSSTPVRRHNHHFSRTLCQQLLNATITSSALSWQRLPRPRALYPHHVWPEEKSSL